MDTQEQARRPVAQLSPRARQGGWIGQVVILIALVIVAWLAQSALRQYGMLGGAAPASKAAAAGKSSTDQVAPPATPMSALEKARGVEQQVQQGAQEQTQRIDEQTK